jgi:tetratricopeptide (TPR) repeat protein
MKGNHQIALDYANKILKAMSANSGYMSLCSPEIAIILRLMGKYEEALQEFDGYLEMFEPRYGDLIQICYLKYSMNDKRGAFQYALRAKRLEGELDKPGYGAFCLGIQALPDEFRQRLLIVDESTWPELSSFNWGPHRELWTENARKSLDAKQQSESLKRIFNRMARRNMTADLLFKSINTFLELAFCNARAVEVEVVIKAIFAIEELPTLTNNPHVSKGVTALIEEFYKVLSIEQLNMVELELEKRQDTDFIQRGVVDFERFMFEFRYETNDFPLFFICFPF